MNKNRKKLNQRRESKQKTKFERLNSFEQFR